MKYFLTSLAVLFCCFPVFAQELTQLTYAQLDSLHLIEYNKGAFAQAIPYMQAGQDKARKDFGEMDSIYAEYTTNLGFFYDQIGQYKKAEACYLEAIKIQKKIMGEQHPNYANSLNNLATLYMSMNRYEKAEAFLLQTKDIVAKTYGVQHPAYASTLNNLAGLYKEMGNYEKAEPLYWEAKNIKAKTLGEQHPEFGISVNTLASLYQAMGSYEKAEPLYLQAQNVFAKSFGENHPYFARSLNNLALLYKEMGHYEKAEPLYLKAKDIWKKSLGELNPNYASSLNNLAALYQNMGQYEKVVPLLLQSIGIQAKTQGAMSPNYASSLNNLAFFYAKDLGLYEKAEPLYLEAKNIFEKTYGTEHPSVARSLSNMALFYQRMGKIDTAFSYAKLGMAAISADIDHNFQDWANLDKLTYYSTEQVNKSLEVLIAMMEAQYQKTGDKSILELSYQTTQAGMRLNERFRNDFSGESDKLRALSVNYNYVLKGIQLGAILAPKDYAKDAFGFAEMNKGVLLMDAAKTSHAHQFGDLPDSLAAQEQLLQKTNSDLEANLLESSTKETKDSLLTILNQTKQEIGYFTNILKKNYPKYAALKYENKTAGAAEIQALLDDHPSELGTGKTALLEYVISDSVVYIFYVDNKQVLLEQKKINRKVLTSRIKELHSILSDYELIVKDKDLAYKKYTENAYWFYENLAAPVLSNAKNINKLIIVSDGELGHLPFEAFLVEPAPQAISNYAKLHYLVNDYKISYNYSATLWKLNKEAVKNKNNGQLLAMAADYDITLDTSTARSSKIDWRLPAHQRLREGLGKLPAAQKEVQTLASTFNGFFALDKLASEKNFKEKAGDYAVIHLAMHGLLDPNAPILSSLAFTEDGDSVENNFLHAYEISKMKLNADLVVLSACETGYGRFDKGNGIASLAQAFAYAGAPALVVSLWQVNDYVTSEIMKNFYQNLANGMEKDEALQQAKMQYIKDAIEVGAHPAFWSPFILMGNTDAIYLKTKGGYWGWMTAIGLGLLVLGLGFALRKR